MGRYEYRKTSARKTGFSVMSCTDTYTGLVVRTPMASDRRSFPGVIAYIGARFSRDRSGLLGIMAEVEADFREGRIPERRLGRIVRGLKHQSPGGMAHVPLVFEKLPLITAAALFRRTVLHDGQESSTRYIDFASGNDLPRLETLLPLGAEVDDQLRQEYAALQHRSLELYLGWLPKVRDAYKDHFKVNTAVEAEESALTARAYDTVRGFLLSGFSTSMVYVTNATTMQQMLGDFGAGRLPGEEHLAKAVLALLAPQEDIKGYTPEIKSILNHTEPNIDTQDEQMILSAYLKGQPGYKELLGKKRNFEGLVRNSVEMIPLEVPSANRLIAQQIMVINPSLRMKDVLGFVEGLNDEQMDAIGRIIYSRRDRFSLPAMASSGGVLGLDFNIDLGIERDLGRHRIWDRVSPIHETYFGFDQVGETGFTQAAYLREIPEFAGLQRGMERDMNDFYERRKRFLEKLERKVGRANSDKVGMYLLPLANQVEMIMNGDFRSIVHFQDIRIREGVHIDARKVIVSANQQVAQSHPLFRSLGYSQDRVLVDDKLQFLSRD